ncbi:ER lumen protein retaining receptor [Nematocida sp. ERTm5]|nr:ER lumen protein retaining receptor [Nematocida sp. ERTm5]
MFSGVGALFEVLLRTFADVLHTLSMLILLVKMNRTKSCSGISLRSQILYLSVYVLRYLDLFYLMVYPSKKIPYRLIYNSFMKIFFISLQLNIIYKMLYSYYYSYDKEYDDMPIVYIIAVALVSGLLLCDIKISAHIIRGTIEWLWAASIVLESVSILPQLSLLHRVGEGEILTIEYVITLGLYRFIYMLIWIGKFVSTGEVECHLLLWGSVVQSVIYLELFWVYANRVIKSGRKFTLKPKKFLRDAFL